MARRDVDERNIRKIYKNESSYMISLPIEAIREFGWRKGQKVVAKIDKENSRLIISDWEE